MIKVTSLSKMRESLPLPPAEGKKRVAIFENGKETPLSDSDYKFLTSQKDGPFNFLVEEGTFIVSSPPKEEEKPLSKKEKKKLEAEAKKQEKKAADEAKKARQGK